MVLSEFLERLAEEGQPVAHYRVAYAAKVGLLGNITVDGAGNRRFTDEHLRKMLAWLKSGPRRGRRSHAERQAARERAQSNV